MAIIYTYPSKSVIKEQDLFLMTDSEDGNKTKNASFVDIKDSLDVVDSLSAGPGISISSSTGDVTISNTGVLSLTSSYGTYISGTINSSATGNVKIEDINLSATGTPSNTNFLRGDNKWDAISLTTDVTGILPIANGGTNASTANAAINNLLPDQSGQNGKVLISDGTDTSWASISGTGTVTEVTSTNTNLLTVANGTTTPALTIVTDPITAGGTGLATSAQIATFIQGKGYITGNETITLSGDVTGTGTTAITTSISNDVVDFDMLNTGVINNASEKQSSLTGNEQVLISTPPPTQGQLPVLNKLPIDDIAGLVSVPTVTATSPITATPGSGTTLIEIGNIPVSKLNSGTNATKYTYWQGNGQWSSPSGYTPIDWQGPEVDHYTITNRFDVYMFTSSSTFELSKMTILVNATGGATYTAAIYSAAGLLTASGSVTPSSGIVQITNILMDSGSKPKFDAGGQYYVAIMTTGSANTTSIAGVPHLMGNTVGGQLIGGSTASSNLPVANNLPTSLTDPELILNTLSNKFACTLT